MKFFRLILTVLIAPFLTLSTTISQESTLKLSEIMAGNDFIGHQPSDFIWHPDGDKIYFKWQKEGDLIPQYYSYTLKTEKIEKLEFTPEAIEPIIGFETDEQDHIFFKSGASVFRYKEGKSTPVFTHTNGYRILNVIDNKPVIWQGDNLYILNTENGSFLQVTNFLPGNTPDKNAPETYLKTQELALFETVRSKKKKNEAQKEYRKATTPQFLNPVYLEGWSLDDISISDQLDRLVFLKSKYPKNQSTQFTTHITEDGYARSDQARAKVGTENPKHLLYVWDLKKDTAIKVDFSNLTDLNRVPDFYNNYPDNKTEEYEKDIIHHIHGINETGEQCLIEIKSYDNKDRWIGTVDMSTGKFTEYNHQHDEKWIGGPGITGWNMVAGNAGWMDKDCFFFQSEESGYSHLYMTNVSTGKTTQLTSGNYEIHEAELSKDKTTFYITANKKHPGNREFYHLNIKSKQLTPVLTEDGNHEVVVSPDEKWLLVNYSYKNVPWDLYLAPNKANSELKQITQSPRSEFESYSWREPEVITFKASDGQDIYARLYTPEEKNKNGAAVFFVHGAGYLQNAHNWWSGYYREYMFNNLLCDMGFTVMDVDYRASKGYGRDFRTSIYRHMGGKDLSDYIDARTYLIDNHKIDPDRIGIYGGSYGGFITIMALLTEPGKFQCGAAVRSVTDWAHYNHPYTSNILNTPTEDPEAFEQSSPIYFAENLEDRLLMLHGMVDDNVQYQDVVRLSQRFIELGKTGWDLVGYPVEPHGFKETTSWVDEYGRILKLFREELLN